MGHRIRITRRQFIAGVAAGSAAAGHLVLPGCASTEVTTTARSAADPVPHGKEKVAFSRLGMGTGSRGGKVQRELGQKQFTALVRHAVDRGITFIDTSDTYRMHAMVREALKGVDRESVQIQTKIPATYDDPAKQIDRFRKELGTEYFDSLLIHCMRTPNWVEEQKRLREVVDRAKEKQVARTVGNSQHGLPALQASALTDWGDVNLVRINHTGAFVDGPKAKWGSPGNVKAAVANIWKMHNAGKGIMGMKLIGNGTFANADTRRQSIEFALQLGCIDSLVIGFKSPAEIDEAIANINRVLAAA